jgi:AcrR family transcriptional regulator
MSTLKNKKKRTSYHHGDLRNVLIDAGITMLAEEGAEVLSLRGLARRAGVSHNAPYQHFADKETFLAAIAEQGFELLARAIDNSQSSTGPGTIRDRLIAAGQGYVRFALEHPHHFRLMFGPRAHAGFPGLSTAARSAFERLAQIVAEGQRQGTLRGDDPREPAMVVWLAAHGLSAVLIAEKIPLDIVAGREPLEMAARYIGLVCEGVLATHNP